MYQTIKNQIQELSPQAQLLAVSKGQSMDNIDKLIKAGQRHFGENRVQEAEKKWSDTKKTLPDLQLHLIGPLQSNKVAEAIALFDVIETIDRPKIAHLLAEEEKKQNQKREYFIQVNIGNEPQKHGVACKDLPDLLKECRELGLYVTGLMCVPPADMPPAPYFALLKKLAHENNLNKCSMGMSSDYQTALRLGATEIRIGTAIFGERLSSGS